MIALSTDHARLIRDSFARIALRTLPLAESFYAELFRAHPELRPIFPDRLDGLVMKLTDTMAFVTRTASDPERLAQPLRDLAHRHKVYGVSAAQYELIGPVLLRTLAELDGAEMTEAELAAWDTAIQEITTFMARETVKAAA
ncbi:MAG: globin domain-containing protein [Pseudomonadota bacterium]